MDAIITFLFFIAFGLCVLVWSQTKAGRKILDDVK